MFIYELTRNDEQTYCHAYIKIWAKTENDYRYNLIAVIRWQGNKNNFDGFYGFRLEMAYSPENNKSYFEEFLKLGKKLISVWNNSPEDVLEFLQNNRSFVQGVYDERVNDTITISDFYKTENLYPFKVYVNGSYYTDVLAISENDAKNKAMKYFSDNGYYSYLENFILNGRIETKNCHFPYLLTNDKWLK